MSSKKSLKVGVVFVLFIFLALAAQAGTLENRSRGELRMGGWLESGDAKVALNQGGALTSVKSGSPIGGVGFNHWIKENWSIFVSASVLSIETETLIEYMGVTTSRTIVSPIIVGARHYIPMNDPNSIIRPYLEAGAGIFVGSQEKSEISVSIVTESRTETTFGGRVGGGFDLLLSRRVTLGLSGLFNAMVDFNKPIGSRKNYNGAEFSLVFGILFG